MDEMNERVFTPVRGELKRTAKQFMRGKNPSPWLVVLAAIALQNVLTLLQMQVTGLARVLPELMAAMERYSAGGDPDVFLEAYFTALGSAHPGFGGWLITILLGLASLMISTGLILFYIETVRTRKGGFGNLLDGLTKLPRVIGYNIMVFIFTLGWMMLPYLAMLALTFISIAMNSLALLYEVGILDCITLSKQIMKLRKGEYFVLMLSFLGWSIGLYLMNLVLSMFGYLGVLLSLPLTAYVQMYKGFTYFLYHEAIQGRTYDPTQPLPPELPGDNGPQY